MLALANLAAWILQTTILVAVALAAIRLLRLDAPAVRYHFLRALLVICLALPFVQPRVEQVAPRQAPGGGVGSVRHTRLVVGAAGDRLQDAAFPARCRDDARRDRDGAAFLVDRCGILAAAPPAARW